MQFAISSCNEWRDRMDGESCRLRRVVCASEVSMFTKLRVAAHCDRLIDWWTDVNPLTVRVGLASKRHFLGSMMFLMYP